MLSRLRIENLVLIRDAELAFAPGLNVITGETGAGKTILAQAFGLLLGTKGDAGFVGLAGEDAYVEAELDVSPDFLAEDGLEPLAELRPEDEDGLVIARRVFADGRTRAYAWGRSAAREDVGGAAERLVAMSGQFEQRRLARPSYQIDALDAFAGAEQLRRRAELRSAWRELLAARRATTSSPVTPPLRRRGSLSSGHSSRTRKGSTRASRRRFARSASASGTRASSWKRPRPPPRPSTRRMATAQRT